MRLIDADALWLDIANRSACYHDCCPRTKGKGGVLLLIDEAPTIEAEPVTHCKDCRYLLKDHSRRRAHLCVRERFARQIKLDDFCSHGERKDGEQNEDS